MAQRGYPGIHAGMPTPQCLRSAIVVNGASRSRSKAKQKRGACPASMWLSHRIREQARSHRRNAITQNQVGYQAAPHRCQPCVRSVQRSSKSDPL
ncbi:hypothetical protein C1C98_03630 [Pseudomonas ogarae]|uniref:Nucleoid-structuring protein H-NS n=1 Tax=Pseudomonas ogarae (strain DSM 112162 / CECT 30235 / F113) TaxID=1114970 RepID=A0ABN5G6A7_PSEO1|nr:hypothetical protein C1C98_03630 [Pseudomonas ogarae]